MAPDVFKILKDLEAKSVGIDPGNNKMSEGYFTAFRSVGLPIRKEDFADPWSPLDAPNVDTPTPQGQPADPATVPNTDGRNDIDEKKIALANVSQSMKSFVNTFYLTDSQLVMNNAYQVMPGAAKVSDAWWAVTTGATGIPSKTGLSPDIQAAYDAARALMMDEQGHRTPEFTAYLDAQKEYRDAIRAYNRAYAVALSDPAKFQMWPADGLLYHDEIDDANDRWISFGFKNEIDSALATLASQGTDPAIAMIGRARDRFANSLSEFSMIGRIPYTMMLPSNWYDKDIDDGWNTYTSNDYHSESHFQSSSTSYGGGGGVNVGFFSIGGGFEHSENQSSLDWSTNDLEISFSYATVDIVRPWMDTSLLNLSNWFLFGDYQAGDVSSGGYPQSLPENGVTFFPSVVTSLILVKDLRIRWSDWKSKWSSSAETNDASLSVGWGPFAVSGHYSHHEERQDFVADASGESLHVPGVQLIGYVSAINPKSPMNDSAPFMDPE